MLNRTEPADFETWYRHEHPRLVTLVTAIVGDAEIGREAVDEALARAYERWDRVAAMSSPTGWTYRVGLNAARRRARRRTMEERLLRRWTPRDVPGPTGEVWMLVADLPVRQRTAVLLRHVGQMTEAEIADVMGVRRGTVSSTLRAAYRRLGGSSATTTPTPTSSRTTSSPTRPRSTPTTSPRRFRQRRLRQRRLRQRRRGDHRCSTSMSSRAARCRRPSPTRPPWTTSGASPAAPAAAVTRRVPSSRAASPPRLPSSVSPSRAPTTRTCACARRSPRRVRQA